MVFVRYVAVQVLAYILDFGGFFVLSRFCGVEILWANVLGKIFAGALAFVLHRRFTFAQQGLAGHARSAISYFALLGLSTPASSVVLAALLRLVDQPWLAKIVSDLICVVVIFFISKNLVFSSSPVRSSANTISSDEIKAE